MFHPHLLRQDKIVQFKTILRITNRSDLLTFLVYNWFHTLTCILSNWKFDVSVQNVIQLCKFLLCILYYWPEDGPLRSKHTANLKIWLLAVVLTDIYFSCYCIYNGMTNVNLPLLSFDSFSLHINNNNHHNNNNKAVVAHVNVYLWLSRPSRTCLQCGNYFIFFIFIWMQT
jgi:hypothetical protein